MVFQENTVPFPLVDLHSKNFAQRFWVETHRPTPRVELLIYWRIFTIIYP